MQKVHFQLCRKPVKLIWVQNMMERSLGYVQILSSACSLSQMWLWHVVQICILLTALPSFLLWKEEAKASRCWKWKHKMCLVKTSHFRSWCTMQVCIYWCQLGYQVSSSKRQKKNRFAKDKVEMIFSSFPPKNKRRNSTLLLWNLVFLCFLEETEDIKKPYRNQLAFMRC